MCTACGYHYRLSALERIQLTLDEGQILEYDADMISEDPLQFPDYVEKLDKAKSTTKLQDAIITGEGTIGGFPVVIAAMSFDFMGGSLGSVVGERITRAVEAAIEKKVPIIIYSTSGGARMQESILSLMQMAKTSAAISKLSNAGGLFISVITDPTFGGVSASFAMLGTLLSLNQQHRLDSQAAVLLNKPLNRSCRTISKHQNSISSMVSSTRSCPQGSTTYVNQAVGHARSEGEATYGG